MLKKTVEEQTSEVEDTTNSTTTSDITLKVYEYVDITVDKDLDDKPIPTLGEGENFTLFEIQKDGICVVIGPNGYTGKFSPGSLKNKDGGK